MKSSTLSSFTSGVVTIAATIMVLQLTTPESGEFSALLQQWQTLLAHYNSFFLIFVLWYNHAREFSRVEYIKPDLIIYNGIWLVFLALIPFATGWVEHEPNHTAPELVFSVLLGFCIFVNVQMNKSLIKENPDVKFSARVPLRWRMPIYIGLLLTVINAFFIPYINLLIYFVITIYMTYLIVHTKHRDVTIL